MSEKEIMTDSQDEAVLSAVEEAASAEVVNEDVAVEAVSEEAVAEAVEEIATEEAVATEAFEAVAEQAPKAEAAPKSTKIKTMQEKDMKKVVAVQRVMKIIAQVFLYLFLGVMALMVIFPFYWMIISSLKSVPEYELPIPTLFPQKFV